LSGFFVSGNQRMKLLTDDPRVLNLEEIEKEGLVGK
jgi:hypothetical protein